MKNQYSHNNGDRLRGDDAAQPRIEKEEKEPSILDKLNEQLKKIRELKEKNPGAEDTSER
jgi:hypothetical protein